MPVILLTNDDGIHAPGLHALEKPLSELGDVWVVAPNVERSACGRSVTLERPLRIQELDPRHLAVDGTPADCVLLTFRTLVPTQPQVVVAGINHGHNVGEDLEYSGTVGAAAEGALQGARTSLAVSVDERSDSAILTHAANFVRVLVRLLMEHPPPPGCYLNVNIPPKRTNRIRWTRPGDPLPTGSVEVGIDPRGKRYYWIAERPEEEHPSADTDRGALRAGCISLSLLTLNRSWQGSWKPPPIVHEGYLEDPL